ncbi:MAG: ATP phosphoribosyltransferase regulatory subunit, partial [Anaerolineae bacterium]|nr:ATP phosphoribosyltransferase regulatory subunit [Anaerolineae bacterium]
GLFFYFYHWVAFIVGVYKKSAFAFLVALNVRALKRLGFPQFSVKINHRQLLTAIGEYSGVPKAQLPDLYRSVDKFDKIGATGVEKELVERGIDADVVKRMMSLITNQQIGVTNLDYLDEVLGHVAQAQQSIKELREIATYLDVMGVSTEHYAFDLTMVRGLGYYTGPIFETVISEPNLGSISGGGRYDDLIGIFRKDSLPTTGTSFGIERILVLMDELNLYPANIGGTVVDVLVTVMDETMRPESMRLASELREAGIHVELV